MSISILLAEKIAQLFLILLMGYLVVRVGLLKPEDSRVLSVIMVYLVMPCMILNATTRRRCAPALRIRLWWQASCTCCFWR